MILPLAGMPPLASRSPAACGKEERVLRNDPQLSRAQSGFLAHTIAKPVIAVVMGISGSGKTTVSILLAKALDCKLQEGDDLHPHTNIEKMHKGIPLTDADRLPWLQKIAQEIKSWRERGESGVLSCSALKRSYRDIILGGLPDVTLIYLKGSYDLIHQRMAARHGHFMPLGLLDSQFASLEEPTPDEHPVTVDVAGTPAEIVAKIVRQLKERSSGDLDNRSAADVAEEPKAFGGRRQ
jgi:carbohydrate kinase (thermoresistant glucokinase family)